MIKLRFHYKSGKSQEIRNNVYNKGEFEKWANDILYYKIGEKIFEYDFLLNIDNWIRISEVERIEEILE